MVTPLSELNRILADNLALALVAIGGVLVILLIAVAVQGARLGHALRAYQALGGDSQGVSLPQLLESHMARVGEVSSRLEQLARLHDYLEVRSRGSLQHIGLVRFNPFEDTGSDQSFAIALLDDRRDGIVISSLHGRGTTRLFAKPVDAGESRHALSDEEAQAIRIAVEGTSPIPSVDGTVPREPT
jgi:hypothetical protein